MTRPQQQVFDPTPGFNRAATSGPPRSHRVGTRLGAIVGAVAVGAAWGTVVGPVGTLVAGAIGAVYGGMAGRGMAEMIDPALEDAGWRETYSIQPYVMTGAAYDDYANAYRGGVS